MMRFVKLNVIPVLSLLLLSGSIFAAVPDF
jgi:hypothetical protein